MKTLSDITSDRWEEIVKKNVEETRFGQVLVTIHDGRVVQVERTEKTRLNSVRNEPRAE